jgi:hypothetical protein
MQSIENQLLIRIKKSRRGTLFFIDSFLQLGNTTAIAKGLERLTILGEIQRVATGIYVRPKKDKIIGFISPSIEDIAKAIARRDNARIMPTGSYALYKLGLSPQVPMNIVYYTDASARKITVGKQIITFKRAVAKKLAFIGNISSLVIQAIIALKLNNIDDSILTQLKSILQKEENYHLQHDIKLAPAWVKKILKKIT